MDIAIMIEGQHNVNWTRWQTIAKLVEELGFAGLYRSDHFTNMELPALDSLELWTSLTWLATHTKRIEFGPLVTPASFRDPVFTARIAKDVDDLSGGRLTLGVGAGWQELEHNIFGYDLLEVPERFARFEESLEVISGLLRSDDPVDFSGDYYTLRDAVLLPRPQREGGPPLLIGGNGPNRTLPLVARFADEWNGVYLTAEGFAERSRRLDGLLTENGRDPGAVRRSLMTGLVFGRTDVAVQEKLGPRDGDEVQARGMIVGTPSAIQEQLAELAEVGVERVMLQWLDIDALLELEALAKAVL
jgi:F420-dependent oxidoreductase-like protein